MPKSPDTPQSPDKISIYRRTGELELRMHQFMPLARVSSGYSLVFFHGGGWTGGSPEAFYPVANAFREAGHWVFLPQYRLTSTHKVPLWDIVADAHAALDWVMAQSASLGIEKARIGAGGGSAGGHLALCTALIPPLAPHQEAPRPAFLVLANPVIDTSTAGYGNAVCGGDWARLSPLHSYKHGIPPTVIFHGTHDTTTPILGARAFRDKARDNGDLCDLHEYNERGHGFFRTEPDLGEVARLTDTFIRTRLTA